MGDHHLRMVNVLVWRQFVLQISHDGLAPFILLTYGTDQQIAQQLKGHKVRQQRTELYDYVELLVVSKLCQVV